MENIEIHKNTDVNEGYHVLKESLLEDAVHKMCVTMC